MMYVLEHAPVAMLERTMQGVVEKAIGGHLTGRVKVMGVSWKARFCTPRLDVVLAPGALVTIAGRYGNTLLVCPFNSEGYLN